MHTSGEAASTNKEVELDDIIAEAHLPEQIFKVDKTRLFLKNNVRGDLYTQRD